MMTTSMVRGIDCSYDPLTDPEARRLVEGDIDLFGQCLWTGREAPQARINNLRVAERAGLYTWGYISLNASSSGHYHVARGFEGVPRDIWDRLLFVAVDIELPGIHEGNILNACHHVEQEGQRAVIYTNLNSWHNYVTPSNTHRLSDAGYMLLNAFWDEHPDIDFRNFPFGGWTMDQIIGEQYTGGQYVHGQYADNAMFYESRLRLPQEEEEENNAMTPEEKVAFRMMADEVKALKGKVALAELLLGCDLRFDRGYADQTRAMRALSERLITVLKQTGLVNDHLADELTTAINANEMRLEADFKKLTTFMRAAAKDYGVPDGA